MAAGPSLEASALEIGSRPRTDRLHALDGLRGAAAVVVLLFHAYGYIDLPMQLRGQLVLTPLHPLINGPAAVHLFFVLSGYVLALTLGGDDRPGRLARYYVRRLFRIHPPYMAAVLFAWAMSRVFVPPGLPTDIWVRLPASVLPVALAFPSKAFGLLGVGWSLFVEMALSALFPLLFWLGRRVHPVLPLAISVLFLRDFQQPFWFLRFMFDFALGLSLQLESARIARLARRLPALMPALLGVAGLALVQIPYVGVLQSVGVRGIEEGHSPSVVLQFGLGSGLLLVAALHSPRLGRALSSRLGRFFGRISYSFYLLHDTILLSFVVRARHHGFAWPTGIAITVLTFALTVALSALAWRFVEAPAIRAGRWLIRTGESMFQRTAVE